MVVSILLEPMESDNASKSAWISRSLLGRAGRLGIAFEEAASDEGAGKLFSKMNLSTCLLRALIWRLKTSANDGLLPSS